MPELVSGEGRHDPDQHHCTIRCLSTAHSVAPYSRIVPDMAWHHTPGQYRTWRSTIRYISTTHTMYQAVPLRRAMKRGHVLSFIGGHVPS
eukprot:1428722-Rhodomonas_salina.2